MANNENTVQIQVEVLRAQLDKLIADINSLKNQKISVKVDTAGAAALEQLSDAVQQMRTGLQDWNVMEAKYDPSTMTLEVQDRSRDRDSGRLIAPVVESGKGYQWKKSAIYKTKQARPFHQKAQELAIGTGLVRDALAKFLTESGFKVKE